MSGVCRCFFGNLNRVSCLVDYLAPTTSMGLAQNAIRCGNVILTRTLVYIDGHRSDYVFRALECNQIEVLKMLMITGFYYDARSSLGQTVLHMAVY